MKDIKAVAIYYNAADKIVGGAYTFVDFIPAGRSAAVEITAMDTIPRVTSTKVFVQVTNLSMLE